MAQRLIRKLRSKGLVPAVFVSFALAAAFLAAPVGAALRPFLATAYPCTAVTLTAAPPTTTSSGTSVLLTASGTCPTASPSYEFWAMWQGTSTWVVLRGYTTTATFTWDSTGALAGTEHFGVWARDATSSAAYDTFTSIAYGITASACASVAITPAPSSIAQGSGTHVIVTGAAAGCTNASPLYEFWAMWAGTSTWIIVQPYSTVATFNWNSAGALPGTEHFGVWVKDAKSTAAYDAFNSATVTVTGAACASVTITPASASVVQGAGAHDILTGAAAGCTNASPLYEFWAMWAGTSTWIIVQPYSATATFNWNSAGALPGVEHFGVWVHDAGNTAAYDAFNSATVTVTAAACASVTITPAPTTVVHGAGTHVILTGAGAGCTNASPLYEFWAKWAGTTTWVLLQGYSAATTFNWDSTGALAGTESFAVWVKDANSTAPYDAFNSVSLIVT